jgi:predicted glycoside hydrolase/deacetylase ChbG (UPF0249 family)
VEAGGASDLESAVIVCADDFGQTEDIDAAVLHLARQGRISAVSCMIAVGRFPPAVFRELLRVEPTLDVGLHLVLTDVRPLEPLRQDSGLVAASGSFHSFRRLLGRCVRGGVDPQAVSRETKAQYARFVDLAGRPPDFVDGHMHAHQLPGVAAGVLRSLGEVAIAQRPYVRNSAMSLAKIARQGVSPLKAFVLGGMGQVFRRAAAAAGFRTNRGFAGVYDYRRHAGYPAYLRRFVACMEGETGILMVHPGQREPWRRAEFEALRDTALLAGRINRFSP